ncbi:MAG: Divergent polysaccharide deacetylase [Syntrophaceae bacterium PtaB.Bin038]|nr:MAG: Divergent polysaccharide deacetylase [Syntrophaceae bacterium PtaB.Bin038]
MSPGKRAALILLVACITGLIALWLIPDGDRRPNTPAPTPQAAPGKSPGAAAPDPAGPAPAGGRERREKTVAILIDDIGYDPEALRRLLAIEAPLAFSVLPHTPHARSSAEAVHRARREVLLHLPMEPHGWPERDPGRGAIFASMTEREIRRTLLDDLESVPHARGVNNHMGSKLMEERDPIRTVFRVLQEKGLFFVDSLTTEASVGPALAAECSIRFARRDLFIDDAVDRSRAAIRLEQLLDDRETWSELLLIGHPYPETVSALEEAIPRFRAAGIRVVPLSARVDGMQGRRDAKPQRTTNRNRTP